MATTVADNVQRYTNIENLMLGSWMDSSIFVQSIQILSRNKLSRRNHRNRNQQEPELEPVEPEPKICDRPNWHELPHACPRYVRGASGTEKTTRRWLRRKMATTVADNVQRYTNIENLMLGSWMDSSIFVQSIQILSRNKLSRRNHRNRNQQEPELEPVEPEPKICDRPNWSRIQSSGAIG